MTVEPPTKPPEAKVAASATGQVVPDSMTLAELVARTLRQEHEQEEKVAKAMHHQPALTAPRDAAAAAVEKPRPKPKATGRLAVAAKAAIAAKRAAEQAKEERAVVSANPKTAAKAAKKKQLASKAKSSKDRGD